MRLRLENPIVTRTLRGRLRGGRAVLWPGIFLFVLIAILILIVMLLQEKVLKDAPAAFRFYFWTVVCIDLVAMVLVATVNTATNLAREKELLTLDFLRISGLGPVGIALGHLLGGLSVPLILAGVSAPLAILAASIGAIPVRDVVTVAVLLLVYSLFASSFALVVGFFVKKTATASGWALAPILFLGLFGIGFVVQNSWPFSAMAFVSPGNFLLPLIIESSPFLSLGLVPIPIFGVTVDPFLFNMGILVFFSSVLIVGVSRKLERQSRSFLSPMQAFVVAAAILLVLGGLFDSGVEEAAMGPASSWGSAAGLSAEAVVVLFLSMTFAVLIAFLVITTPSRDRFLRGKRIAAFRGQTAKGAPIMRHRILYAPALMIIIAFLLTRILSRIEGALPIHLPQQLGYLIIFLLFYAILIGEAKFCFGRSYIPWLAGGLSFAWLILPMTAAGVAAFDAVKGFAWPLSLGSPQTVFAATLGAFEWEDVFGFFPLDTFVGISIGLHVILALLLGLHLSRLQRVILAESEGASKPLTAEVNR